MPAHPMLGQMATDNKRPLNSPEDMNDPQWKRVRFEGAVPQPNGPSAQHAEGAQRWAEPPRSTVCSPTPEASPEDFPVVEALVRREGTDRFRRVQVDGQMNAAERAEAVFVRLLTESCALSSKTHVTMQ
jgi:hypothetical protein